MIEESVVPLFVLCLQALCSHCAIAAFRADALEQQGEGRTKPGMEIDLMFLLQITRIWDRGFVIRTLCLQEGTLRNEPSVTNEELQLKVKALEQRIKEFEQYQTSLKQAESAWQESERRFRSLVEATSDWIWEVDSNGRYTYASLKINELLGYAPEEIIGKTPFDLMPKVEAARVAVLFKEIADSRQSFSGLINTNLHKDGQEVIFETNGVPIFDGDGNYAGYRGFDRNITERQRASEALRISQYHLFEAMELAHIVHWEAEPGTDMLVFNDPFYAFCGTTAELEGGYRMKREEYSRRFIHPDDQQQFSSLVIEAILNPEAESVINYEHRIHRRSGKLLHALTRIKIIKDASKYPLRVFGATQDITERKKVEKEREKLIHDLSTAIAQIKTLSGLLPICASCKKIRNSDGSWEQMESYIRDHSEADFSHSICPECAVRLYPELSTDKAF
jgi:PAS domain S-box-containing protein